MIKISRINEYVRQQIQESDEARFTRQLHWFWMQQFSKSLITKWKLDLHEAGDLLIFLLILRFSLIFSIKITYL